MPRISKPPEVRRQEILDTAMELFAEKGYEDTSMADIARRMGVVQGLCYRYFDSKRVLFREAMEQYVRECCAAGLPIIHDRSRTIRQPINTLYRFLWTNCNRIMPFHKMRDGYKSSFNRLFLWILKLNI